MQRGILFIIVLVLCSSCAATLKTQVHKKRLDVATTILDSLNRVVVIKDLQKDIRKIEDNSRIKVTKYTPPDSSGHQSIDFIMEIEKDTRQENTFELKKDEQQTHQLIHQEEIVDNTVITTTEKYEEPPAVQWLKHLKIIIFLTIVGYLVYKFKRE